jgi:hypothetical protein
VIQFSQCRSSACFQDPPCLAARVEAPVAAVVRHLYGDGARAAGRRQAAGAYTRPLFSST